MCFLLFNCQTSKFPPFQPFIEQVPGAKGEHISQQQYVFCVCVFSILQAIEYTSIYWVVRVEYY